MSPYLLTNFEIQKYYRNEPKFTGVSSRINLPKIEDGACVISLDEFKSIRTHLTVLDMNDINIIYFDSFGVKHLPNEIKKFIGKKNIITNIYRIQVYNSIMYGYFCIGLIDFMVKGKEFVRLLKFLFS